MKDRRKSRLRGRKVTAYITNTVIFVFMFFSTLFINSETLSKIAVFIIAAIILNTAIFIGGNVLDKITNLKFGDKE